MSIKLHTTLGFMQVGLEKLRFSKLQSRALVRAGQTLLSISFNFNKIFSINSGPADGILIPNLHKALFVGRNKTAQY
jgi:hypothetical protein